MNSLYYVLTDQHREEFAPVKCNQQTVLRLLRCFQDVVTENKLSALVIEGRCLSGDPKRESAQLSKLCASARRVYQFSCETACGDRTWEPQQCFRLTSLAESDYHDLETGPFILVVEPRFSGLMASCRVSEDTNKQASAYEMIWTFDPNVVFTGIEYLLARVSAQRPEERSRLETLLNATTPRSSSLRLALTFTTKLTLLMQRQNDLEMATNRISSAISGTLELENILQSAVEEVGCALNARRASLVLWQENNRLPEGMSIYARPENPEDHRDSSSLLSKPLPRINGKPESAPEKELHTSNGDQEAPTPAPLEVPICYRHEQIGLMTVEDDTPHRSWEDEEILMVKTVSDQLSVAISHARLFRQVQTQAMTDALTGLYNHRHFQERIDREIKLSDRNDEPVSLVLLDLDRLKKINDTLGHRAGDSTLSHVAQLMRASVRDIDVCARYGGEEFVVVLPQCDREDAMKAAERIREAIASTPVPGIGQVTASLGVASYPSGAKSKEELVEMADRAMYLAKAAGRNRVRTLTHRSYSGMDAK